MSIADLFRKSCEIFPESIAVSMGVQQWTYRQLDAESNRLVDQLKSFGVVRGDIVAISFSRGFEQISSLLALLKMGVAYLH